MHIFKFSTPKHFQKAFCGTSALLTKEVMVTAFKIHFNVVPMSVVL